jgi:uncharacterized protein (DUF433 family)
MVMTEKQMLERIAMNPNVMVGKPVIKGTRLTVEYILGLLAQGASREEIIAEYQGLTVEDIQACLFFATKSLENIDFMPLATG